MTEYGKVIKRRLIDIDKPQNWLIDEVRKETGLFFDSSYLSKITNGKKLSPNVTGAINKILNIENLSTTT